MINRAKIQLISLILIILSSSVFSEDSKILLKEDFEDNNFENRGWYDQLKGNLSVVEHIEGSTKSLEIKYIKGKTVPEGGTPGRHLFEETEEICLSYYVKYSENFVGSNKPYHPHEFHFLTNIDSKWVGPAFTHLTTYIEQNAGVPILAIQDGENIDQKMIGANLVGITENRSVAGCNGSKDGYYGDCYKSGNLYVNGKQWKAAYRYFSDSPGKYYKNQWHFIQAYFKLNSITNGISNNDGIVKYWYDGELMIDHSDIEFRTAKNENMKFNQFLIAPYIGDGSPIDQYMWIDNLTISTKPIITGIKTESNIHSLISPNPANDYITVSHTALDAASIEIFNVFGEKIPPRQTSSATPHTSTSSVTGNIKIDVSDLAPGVYFIKIGDKFEKFIKM